MEKKLVIIILLLFTVTISGCTFKTDSDQTFGEKAPAKTSDLYLLNTSSDHYDQNGTQYYYVWGYVGNKADKGASNVEITAKFYDESGKLIGTNKTSPYKPKVVPPAGKSYFYVGIKDQNVSIVKYDLSLDIKK